MNNNDKWLRYCDLLFRDDLLGFWLDISRMDVKKSDFEEFKDIYSKAFDSLESLENGSIAILMKAGKLVITGFEIRRLLQLKKFQTLSPKKFKTLEGLEHQY